MYLLYRICIFIYNCYIVLFILYRYIYICNVYRYYYYDYFYVYYCYFLFLNFTALSSVFPATLHLSTSTGWLEEISSRDKSTVVNEISECMFYYVEFVAIKNTCGI